MKKMLKEIAERAKLGGRITNHSMRKTTVTRLAKANTGKAVIKAITGHRSDAGLEAYRIIDDDDMSSATRTLGDSVSVVASTTSHNATHVKITHNAQKVIATTKTNKEVNVLTSHQTPQQFHFHNCTVTFNNNNSN